MDGWIIIITIIIHNYNYVFPPFHWISPDHLLNLKDNMDKVCLAFTKEPGVSTAKNT